MTADGGAIDLTNQSMFDKALAGTSAGSTEQLLFRGVHFQGLQVREPAASAKIVARPTKTGGAVSARPMRTLARRRHSSR
jgi:hypothetical protein